MYLKYLKMRLHNNCSFINTFLHYYFFRFYHFVFWPLVKLLKLIYAFTHIIGKYELFKISNILCNF